MSQNIQLPDDQYKTLKQAADQLGKTLDQLLTTVVDDLRSQPPVARVTHTYSAEEWLRHLGATDEQIVEALPGDNL